MIRLPRRLRGGGPGVAQVVAESFASTGSPGRRAIVNPRLFDRTFPTSTRRRWSILFRVPMVRDRAEHPRPWEGPIVDFSGIFRSIDRAAPGRVDETAVVIGRHPLHEMNGKLAELDTRIRQNMERASWPRIGGVSIDACGPSVDWEAIRLSAPPRVPMAAIARLSAAPAECESCGEVDPTVKHRERTGGPDGYLCDDCETDVRMSGAEPQQF